MLTSKQRATLRGLANTIEPIFQVGKGGISPEFVQMVADALEKRELVKLTILNNCMLEPREVADIISERTRSDIVQVIGKKVTLFKKSEKHPTVSELLKMK